MQATCEQSMLLVGREIPENRSRQRVEAVAFIMSPAWIGSGRSDYSCRRGACVDHRFNVSVCVARMRDIVVLSARKTTLHQISGTNDCGTVELW